MADVTLDSVTRRFGDLTAVDRLSLGIGDGEFVVLLGPTGAGKTTTLRLIAGLEPADGGTIQMNGEDVTRLPPAARDVSFVFQQYSLYPHMKVYDNLAFPLRSPTHRTPASDIKKRVGEIASLLRIEHKLDNKATELSGGEMQRVAIGRALVRNPAIYLMDEPLSSLDAKLRSELRLELKRIQDELGATILLVTHDQIEAMTMADRIGVIREGRLEQVGTPRAIYETPTNVYVASRLGSPGINLLPADLMHIPGLPTATKTVGARTEHIRIGGSAADGRAGVVDRIEHLGDQNHLHLTLDGHRLVTLADPTSDLSVGGTVTIALNAPIFFDRDGNRIDAA